MWGPGADTFIFGLPCEAVEESDPPLAERLYAESIMLAERSGNWSGLLRSHNNLGILLINLERLSEAREHLESALAAASKGGSKAAADNVLGNLGLVLLREGDTDGAATNFVLYLRSARRYGQVRMRLLRRTWTGVLRYPRR